MKTRLFYFWLVVIFCITSDTIHAMHGCRFLNKILNKQSFAHFDQASQRFFGNQVPKEVAQTSETEGLDTLKKIEQKVKNLLSETENYSPMFQAHLAMHIANAHSRDFLLLTFLWKKQKEATTNPIDPNDFEGSIWKLLRERAADEKYCSVNTDILEKGSSHQKNVMWAARFSCHKICITLLNYQSNEKN